MQLGISCKQMLLSDQYCSVIYAKQAVTLIQLLLKRCLLWVIIENSNWNGAYFAFLAFQLFHQSADISSKWSNEKEWAESLMVEATCLFSNLCCWKYLGRTVVGYLHLHCQLNLALGSKPRKRKQPSSGQGHSLSFLEFSFRYIITKCWTWDLPSTPIPINYRAVVSRIPQGTRAKAAWCAHLRFLWPHLQTINVVFLSCFPWGTFFV